MALSIHHLTTVSFPLHFGRGQIEKKVLPFGDTEPVATFWTASHLVNVVSKVETVHCNVSLHNGRSTVGQQR